MVIRLILLLLLLPACLIAQSENELLELKLDDLEYSAWQNLYQELLKPGSRMGLDNRLWLDDDPYSLHQAYLRYKGQELALNFRQDWGQSASHANFSLKLKQDKLIRDIAMGHYRIRFGTGISLGSGSKNLKETVLRIESPPAPQRFSPFGAAVTMGWEDISGLVFGSVASREARLDNSGKIVSLPKTRSGLDPTTLESLWGVAIGYEPKLFRLGALAYWQSYDREFSSAALQRTSSILSWYGGLRLKQHSLNLESGVVGKAAHHYLGWTYRHQGFEQTLSFAIDPDPAQLAHFTPREVLSRDSDTMELAWNARFPLFRNAALVMKYSADHRRAQALSANSLKTRLLAAFSYNDKLRDFSARLSHFDREVLQHVDADYNLTRPKHWRFELGFKDLVIPSLQLQLNCRYHIEDRSSWKDNGFYYHSALRFTTGRLALRLGYQGWQSSRESFYYEDDTPLSYSVAGKDDQNIYLTADLAFKQIKLGLNLRQSLNDQKDQRMILRVGTWI